MLTDEQIADLRAACERIMWKAAEGLWGVCIDGPLQGLKVRIDANTCKRAGACWCLSYPGERGPVVAEYTHAPEPGHWRFRGYNYPGRRESSHT